MLNRFWLCVFLFLAGWGLSHVQPVMAGDVASESEGVGDVVTEPEMAGEVASEPEVALMETRPATTIANNPGLVKNKIRPGNKMQKEWLKNIQSTAFAIQKSCESGVPQRLENWLNNSGRADFGAEILAATPERIKAFGRALKHRKCELIPGGADQPPVGMVTFTWKGRKSALVLEREGESWRLRAIPSLGK